MEKKPRNMDFQEYAMDEVYFPITADSDDSEMGDVEDNYDRKKDQIQHYLSTDLALKDKFQRARDVTEFLVKAVNVRTSDNYPFMEGPVKPRIKKLIHEKKNATLYNQAYVKSALGRPVTKLLDLYLNQLES
jgi:hypothetical protein